MAKNSV